MSLAKLHHIKSVRKPGVCGSCGGEIAKGDGAIRFTVGYRGVKRVRCTKTGCFPKPSERESSMVADVYAAQESANFEGTTSIDEIRENLEAVAEVADSVADDYESNEMFERNPDLQERADMVRSAADELRNWEPEDEEPEHDDWFEDPDHADADERDFEIACQEWLEAARQSAKEAVEGMELP